jgi:DNA-binding MarR family transcriptional regulator
MDPVSIEQLKRFKERYPGMDFDMVRFFARTMSTLHDIATMMESHFARLGLSRGRFMLMIQLHGHDDPDGLSISEMMSEYRVSSATMTGIVDTLEKEGLIERIRSPKDRRRVNVRITPAGREFMDQLLPRHHECMKVFSSRLNDRERQTLIRLMNKLHEGVAEGVDIECGPSTRSAP